MLFYKILHVLDFLVSLSLFSFSVVKALVLDVSITVLCPSLVAEFFLLLFSSFLPSLGLSPAVAEGWKMGSMGFTFSERFHELITFRAFLFN